jgi:hypothetical protein
MKNIKFKNGANKETARTILDGIKKDISFRENTIVQNLATVERNKETPAGYIIYSFFDNAGNGFEAGKTPAGYSITC